jgi:hypothetical protein
MTCYTLLLERKLSGTPTSEWFPKLKSGNASAEDTDQSQHCILTVTELCIRMKKDLYTDVLQ